MRSAILAIGDEIVLAQQADTNTAWLAQALCAAGCMPIGFRAVPDDRAAIAEAFTACAAHADVVVSTGGLGPTLDDLTREALRDVVDPGGELVEDSAALVELQRWFAGRGRAMNPANRVQALRPATATLVPNPIGTAPGLAASMGSTRIFCLPGPPREMQPMYAASVLPVIEAIAAERGGSSILTASVAQIGLGESDAAARLGDLMKRDRSPSVGTTASGGVVTARIRVHARRDELESARRALEATVAEVESRWAPFAFGRDGRTLVETLRDELVRRSLTLAVAESCTGGLLGATIVDLAGSSAFFLGGFLTYSNALKTTLLGVPASLIEHHGAVSETVARAMAVGAIERSGAPCSLAITGIAGPEGGSETRPVGTTFIALGQREPAGTVARVRRFHFTGTRRDIRERAALMALQMLRVRLLGADEQTLLWEVRGAGDEVAPVKVVAPREAGS